MLSLMGARSDGFAWLNPRQLLRTPHTRSNSIHTLPPTFLCDFFLLLFRICRANRASPGRVRLIVLYFLLYICALLFLPRPSPVMCVWNRVVIYALTLYYVVDEDAMIVDDDDDVGVL